MNHFYKHHPKTGELPGLESWWFKVRRKPSPNLPFCYCNIYIYICIYIYTYNIYIYMYNYLHICIYIFMCGRNHENIRTYGDCLWQFFTLNSSELCDPRSTASPDPHRRSKWHLTPFFPERTAPAAAAAVAECPSTWVAKGGKSINGGTLNSWRVFIA